jgi:hypothetical protein
LNGGGAYPDRLLMTFLFDLSAGNLKDLQFELPPGFLGSATAIPTCPRELLSLYNPAACPSDTQVGTVEVVALGFPTVMALYNTDPEPGYLAELGFKNFLLDSRMLVKVLPNGQAQFELHDSVQDTALGNLKVEVWGMPADHQTAPTAPRRAFLRLGTRCDGAAPAMALRSRSWQAPQTWHASSATLGPPLTGCESLGLDPQLDFSVDDATTDSPTGAQVTVDLPQSPDPDAPQGARVKDLRVGFPEGIALSPGAATELVACSDDAVRLGEPGPAACPAASKVGTAELSTGLLGEPVAGAVHIGRQLSDSDYRIYIVINAQAIDIELAGTLHADPQTGRLTTEIRDIPEMAVDRLTLSFGGGPHALFVTPEECGSGTASVALTPYSGGPSFTSTAAFATAQDPFGRPCPVATHPFAPRFVAGTSRTRAGGPAPLSVTIRRAPGEQMLDRFSMTLPGGLSAKPAGVPRCSAAAAAAGACPAASRIGAATTESGSGASPYMLEGDAFLTGPYRGAPFGVALVFRAVAGPFDLGTVVIRAALRLDPLTGQVTIDTDRLPRLVKGVPLRIQTIGLDIDRPGFMVNPTSCRPSAITARIASTGGALSLGRSRFAVGRCAALRFRPKVAMTLTERRELRADGHPGLRMRLSAARGGANLREVSFELPAPLGPSVTGPTAICSLTQLEDERCPPQAAIGHVSARTPLLSSPLRGPVYSVQPRGSGPPDLWALMRSGAVHVRFRMKTAIDRGQLRGRLVDLPDIALSRLDMTFAAGRYGMLSLDRAPCAGSRPLPMRAQTRLTAHNSASRRAAVRLQVGPGCRR